MPAVIVEQLNASQWHSCCPDRSGSGVGNWVQAVTDGLLAGSLYGWRVESLDLDLNRLLLAHGETTEQGGAQ